ncbi:MAG: DUF983 domain-containing protein [Alphaproteobacteria bacterium]
MRGLRRRCPACGRGRLFAGYLRVAAQCTECGEPCGRIRADDIPAYMTVLLVGHIVVPALLLVYQNFKPDMWASMLFWPTLTLGLTLALLPRIKGGTVGVMWALRLRGDELQ